MSRKEKLQRAWGVLKTAHYYRIETMGDHRRHDAWAAQVIAGAVEDYIEALLEFVPEEKPAPAPPQTPEENLRVMKEVVGRIEKGKFVRTVPQ